ncbi:uncharacterized protein C8Q71DRAFT_8078 [Rhodofomes roseus]|uniref:Uncharacterized protein n=1 Tax=Rhodofomes roseus TaxID=34475 RepID=A0ABQ8KYP7_9APHY|nr:uncharacterized protein C8Q71DRAFT_8078 [Rhodofomes roseus]KAH9843637.1 hypothetical protein C8Q71DRAFT_8078 [Rhodofomes roseus]
MNRGPIILTIDEAEFLLDQMPAPSSDEDEMVTKLRKSKMKHAPSRLPARLSEELGFTLHVFPKTQTVVLTR